MNDENNNKQTKFGNANGWLDKILGRKNAAGWILTAFMGGLSITFFGGIDDGSNNLALYRYGIPVLLIISYAYLGYKDTNRFIEYPSLRNARIGQLADSAYFLGFLWTLWALIDSFVINQTSVTEAVFRTFGYALVTTATGMFVRLSIIQFSYSSDEQSSLSEQKIEEEIARFSKEVENSTKILKKLQDSIENSAIGIDTAAEIIEENSKRLNDELKLNKEKIDTVADNLTKEVLSSMKEPFSSISGKADLLKEALSNHVDSIQIKSQEATEKLVTVNADISKKISEDLNIAYESSAILAKSMPEKMENIVRSLEEVSNQLNDIKISPDTISNAIKETTAKASEITNERINELLAKFVNQQTLLNSKIEDLSTGIESIVVTTERFSGKIADFSTDIEGFAKKTEGISSRIEQLDNEIIGLSEKLNKIDIPTSVIEDQIKEKLSVSIQQITNSIGQLESSFSEFENTIRDSNNELNKSSKRWWQRF